MDSLAGCNMAGPQGREHPSGFLTLSTWSGRATRDLYMAHFIGLISHRGLRTGARLPTSAEDPDGLKIRFGQLNLRRLGVGNYVVCQVCICGYKRLRRMRASAVVNCQSTPFCAW